jgi:hypothetical protein
MIYQQNFKTNKIVFSEEFLSITIKYCKIRPISAETCIYNKKWYIGKLLLVYGVKPQ